MVGFKPSRGLIGTDGIVPISKGQDVIGTHTRTVKDAAYMLNYMAGRSDADNQTWHIPEPLPDFTASCQTTDLSGLTIGIPRSCFNKDPTSPLMISFASAMKLLTSAGGKVIDDANFPAVEEFIKLSSEDRGFVRTADFKRDIAGYLATLETNPNNLHSLEDIIAFTKSSPSECYPERDIGNFLLARAEKFDVTSDEYKRHVEQEQYFGGEGGILGAMQLHKVDVFVIPSTIGAATDLASKMGFPLISIPLGFHPEGTPVQKEDKKEGLISNAPGFP